ncbi:MAG: SMC family ATPase [Bacteroidia bacterium]
MLGRESKSHEEAVKTRSDLENNLKRFDAQKELMVQLALRRAELEKLEARKTEIENRKEKLRLYESAKLAFASLLQQRSSLNAELAQNKAAVELLEKQAKETAEKLATARRTHAHVKSEYEQREQLQSQADELRRLAKSQDIALEISKLDIRLAEGNSMIITEQQRYVDAQKEEQFASDRYRALREASPDLDTILQAHIGLLADALNTGEPCPVCGSTEHPAPHAGHAQDEAKAPVSAKLLQARIDAAKENSEALKASEAALDQARKSRISSEEALHKLKAHHQDLSNQRMRLQAQIDAETGSFRYIQPDELDCHGAEQLENMALDAMEKYGSLGSLFQKEQERVDSLLADQHKQEGVREQLQHQRRALMQKEASLIQQLQKALQTSDFEKLEVVEAILSEEPDLAAEKLAIERWTQEYTRAEAAVEQAETQTGSINYDSEAHEEAKEKASEIRQEIEQKLIEIGSLKQHIEGLKKQLEEKKEIRKRHRALLRRSENLKLMRKLFTGSGFVNYVSAIYLRQLCQAANERFRKLTHNQLQLEPTEDNSFAVRDFLNDGQLRSHKTLSGGQVFQASLCLALALADQVQARARSRQRFFFIDEGFGALDKHSLRLVFETLRALRKERRIVGVISHVEELQEDIDTYLHISNDGETGSVVHPSWL